MELTGVGRFSAESAWSAGNSERINSAAFRCLHISLLLLLTLIAAHGATVLVWSQSLQG